MSLYRAEPVLIAVEQLLTARLPAAVGGSRLRVERDPQTWTAPLVVVELATSPALTSIHMGGHDWAVTGVQTTTVAASKAVARLLGDQIREALTALTRGGKLATPLTIPGHTVLEVVSAGDGFADDSGSSATAGRSYQWAETYNVRLT